jgi:hypothetical protein
MKKQKRYKTDYLFSNPSFLSGAGTVMNLAGNYYQFNTFDTDFEADSKAIENDFRMIGQDIFDAVEHIKNNKD